MNPADLTKNVHILINIVLVIQLLGAVLTFKPMKDRRRGIGSLSLVSFVIVLAGAARRDLFEPALYPGVLGLLCAVGLFVWARITIQGKFFSYIHSTDVPQFVCKEGPYHWIRHPFYASYLLTLLSTTILFPSYITAVGAVVAVTAFTSSARYEESKFEGSPVAAEYAEYMRHTGRFTPRLSG